MLLLTGHAHRLQGLDPLLEVALHLRQAAQRLLRLCRNNGKQGKMVGKRIISPMPLTPSTTCMALQALLPDTQPLRHPCSTHGCWPPLQH